MFAFSALERSVFFVASDSGLAFATSLPLRLGGAGCADLLHVDFASLFVGFGGALNLRCLARARARAPEILLREAGAFIFRDTGGAPHYEQYLPVLVLSPPLPLPPFMPLPLPYAIVFILP